MPVYEYRCDQCGYASRFYVRTYSAAPPANCRHCDGAELQRIMSSFAYHRSESDKLEQLDSKYYKMVDDDMNNAPRESDPNYHTDKMVAFSQAEQTREPYFKE